MSARSNLGVKFNIIATVLKNITVVDCILWTLYTWIPGSVPAIHASLQDTTCKYSGSRDLQSFDNFKLLII